MEDRYIAYMASHSELRPQHDKAIKVILSCQTLDQLGVAEKFCSLLHKMHLSSAEGTYPSEKFLYRRSLQESQTLITKALTYQRTMIKLLMKRKG
jgi:hypothetical protein